MVYLTGMFSCMKVLTTTYLHRPNEDLNLKRFFMKMKIEDEKPLFFSSSKI